MRQALINENTDLVGDNSRHLRDAVPVIVFFVIVALTWDNVRWYLV